MTTAMPEEKRTVHLLHMLALPGAVAEPAGEQVKSRDQHGPETPGAMPAARRRRSMPAPRPGRTQFAPAAMPPARVPVFVRTAGTSAGAGDKTYLWRKLDRKLGKFAAAVQRASVRLEGINGLRGDIEVACRIKVTPRGRASVVVESRAGSLQEAMDHALAQVARAVRKPVQQRRTAPRAAGKDACANGTSARGAFLADRTARTGGRDTSYA